jgi:excisionase family DNA binding protein
MLSLSRRGIEALIGTGELPSVKIGRRRLIRRADIDALVDRHVEPIHAP